MRLNIAKCNTLRRYVPNSCAIVSSEPRKRQSKSKGGFAISERKVNAKYLGMKEAEELTGISRWTWRRHAYNGVVESIKIGKRLLIPFSEIERLVSEGTRPRLMGR
jgi:hypothetical protein